MVTYCRQVERCLAQRLMEKKLILSSPVTGPNGNNECFNAVSPSTAGLFSRSARRRVVIERWHSDRPHGGAFGGQTPVAFAAGRRQQRANGNALILQLVAFHCTGQTK